MMTARMSNPQMNTVGKELTLQEGLILRRNQLSLSPRKQGCKDRAEEPIDLQDVGQMKVKSGQQSWWSSSMAKT
eukprot:1160280-Pelagomonas_calceolata.AAC.5